MDNEKQTLSETPFWLNDWYVDPRSGRISRQGAEVKLEPKVMQVLVLLATNAGEVLSRELLESKAWDGVVVSYDSLSTTIIKLRKALGDNSRNPSYIETVSKKGYRLIATVRIGDKPASESAPDNKVSFSLTPLAFISMAAILVLAVLLLNNFSGNDSTHRGGADKASLAVLPFTNRHNNPDQEYFSDGITDDLINDLSRFSGLRVIARRSAYIYKRKKTDIQTIAKELNVNYILDGDVRRDGNMVRLNVQLIDAATGTNIWAQRFNRQTKDIFDVQDDIRQNIFNALSITLSKEEQKRIQLRYTENFAAYDLFLKGQASLITRASAVDSKKAQQFMEQAIALDSKFSRAHAALALIHADAFRFDWSDNPAQTKASAIKIGKRAIELDKHSPQAHWIMGYVYLFLFEDHTNAIAMAEKATALAPNDMDAFTVLAVTYAFGDAPEKAKRIVEGIMQKNPRYSALVPSVLGLSNFRLAKYEEALAAYDKSLLINPSRIQGNIYKAVVLYRMGNADDAEFQLDQLYTLHPQFDLKVWASRQPFSDKAVLQQLLKDIKIIRGDG